MVAGGIEVNAPGLIYALGLRMNHGPGAIMPGQQGAGNSTVSGTGEVVGLHSSRDRELYARVFLRLHLTHFLHAQLRGAEASLE